MPPINDPAFNLPVLPQDEGSRAPMASITLLMGNVGEPAVKTMFARALQGERGGDGRSAYETWLAQGHQGSESEFLGNLRFSVGQVMQFLNGTVPEGFLTYPADGAAFAVDPIAYPQLAPRLVDIVSVVPNEMVIASFEFVDANNPSNSGLWSPSTGNPFLDDVEGEIYGFRINEPGANPSIVLTLTQPIVLERLRAVGPSTGALMGSGHTLICNDQGETSPLGQWSEWLETGFNQASARYTFSFNHGSTVVDTATAVFSDNGHGAQGLLNEVYSTGYQYPYAGTPFESVIDFGVPTQVDFIKLSQLHLEGTGWSQAEWAQHRTTHSVVEAWDGNAWITLFDGALPQVAGGTSIIPVNGQYAKFRMWSEAADSANADGDGRLGQMLFYTSSSYGIGYSGVFERLYLFKKESTHEPVWGVKAVAPAPEGYTNAIFAGLGGTHD